MAAEPTLTPGDGTRRVLRMPHTRCGVRGGADRSSLARCGCVRGGNEMAIATKARTEGAAPDRVEVRPSRHRRRTVLVVCGAVAAVLLGLGGYGTVQAGDGSGNSRGWEAWSQRLEAEAEAHLAEQANLARGRAADAARLQAAADAAG